jgi:hypothetical protein
MSRSSETGSGVLDNGTACESGHSQTPQLEHSPRCILYSSSGDGPAALLPSESSVINVGS